MLLFFGLCVVGVLVASVVAGVFVAKVISQALDVD
jgi:hypothetical protein